MAEGTSERARRPGDEHTSGDVLDRRYRLMTRLGRGGFGDVWRAEELLPDGAPFREVALKLLHGGAGDAVDWAEEAKLLASFRHPSLVTIYAAGILETDPPTRYVAMELLEGQNLADLIRERGRIPWRRVLRWACNTAAALDVIHACGVVHLDLKPANLFLSTDGALKVLDFGIARRAGSAAPLARPRGVDAGATTPMARGAPVDGEMGTAMFLAEQDAFAATQGMMSATRPAGGPSTQRAVIGTPGFMAPELLELADPTAAADAYALAVCIVQLTSGHLPHAADDEPKSWDDSTAVSAWLDGIRQATLRGALRDFDADPRLFPRGLAALVRKLLSLDPVHRGVVPGQLGQMLEEVWQRPHGVPDPPYPGLLPYPPQAEGLLFGRDDDIARLGRELELEPAVVLQGVSGVGKTSLAVAGLVPYLALRGVDGKDDWIAARIQPGAAPDQALSAALAAISPELENADAEALAAHCEAAAVGLVLIVDPLVEVLTAPAEARARIVALIAAIAEATPSVDREPRPGHVAAMRGASPGLRVIATLTDEHAAALLASEPLGSSLRAALRFVGAPAPAAVRDIVGGPAHFAGVPLYGIDDVAADVQRELRAGGARLPYVALALRSFWDASTDRGKRGEPAERSAPPPSSLHPDRWKQIGGVRGAIARHADAVFARLSPSQRALADELLLRLSATDGTSIPWDEDELVGTLDGDVGAARDVLATLVREHLVRRQGATVDLGHEALSGGWPHLATARLQSMERLLFLERVREARIAWDRGDRARDLLLQGALFDELQAHPERAERGLTAADRELVRASRRRARLRTGGRILAVLAGVAGVALGLVAKQMVDAARDSEKIARAAAVELERTAELAAKSRRTEDPFRKAAFAVAAMERGSPDGMLPIDLASSVGGLARADFLTLEHVSGPEFPWEDRFLLGQTSSGTLTVVDFHPPESQVIDDLDLDADLDADTAKHFKRPRVLEMRPHNDPLAERAAFAFDTSFATRSVTGEVKIFRLGDSGAPVLAAIAPMRCTGAMRLASAAPVLACPTDQGIARWDLRRARSHPEAAVEHHLFQGNVASISADGARIAATEGPRVLLWAPEEHREGTYVAQAPVTLAEWSPRASELAVIELAGLEIVDFAAQPGVNPDAVAPPRALFRAAFGGEGSATESARWDAGGIDLALCDTASVGRWIYLKHGGRAKDDAPPTGSPCARPAPSGRPRLLARSSDFEELAARDLGPHSPLGGWRLGHHRFLTRDLVVFNGAEPAAAQLLGFKGHDEIGGDDEREPRDSASAVERAGNTVAWQIGGEVRVYSLPDGNRLFSRRGNLLRGCEAGAIRVWQAVDKTFQIVDLWTGGVVATLPREPALVIGADRACAVLYTQRLDGAIVETALATGQARVLAQADGYVYEARPSLIGASTPAGAAFGPSLWMALSSGAIAQIEERTGTVRVAGYATPQATGLAEGARPGDVAYADAGGIVVLHASPREPVSGRIAWRSERVLEATGDTPWEDLSMAADGASMLLASADRIASLDLSRHEIVGWMSAEARTRLTRWDSQGSVIAWSFDRTGGAEGQVIPRGLDLAKLVASSISNLGVEKGKLIIHR